VLRRAPSDENSATDITALLNSVANLALSSGAAVAMAGHFAKGNAAAKETIDRISGSGVFARDPDGLITFTRHEEEGAFAVEMVLRNLPPVDPFVVKWDWPQFKREESLDPSKLKQAVNPDMPLMAMAAARGYGCLRTKGALTRQPRPSAWGLDQPTFLCPVGGNTHPSFALSVQKMGVGAELPGRCQALP
jgi:hypothetical protein